MKVSEEDFLNEIKNIECFYDSDNLSAYPPLITTKRYKLKDGRIAESNILDCDRKTFYIN